jgi:hypothetical protein
MALWGQWKHIAIARTMDWLDGRQKKCTRISSQKHCVLIGSFALS